MKKIIKIINIIRLIGFKEFFKRLLYNYSFDKSSRPFFSQRKVFKEINSFNTRSEKTFDFLIFSITPFDYRIQRPQHFAFYLAKKGHRIFYIENEFLKNKKIDKNGFAPYLIKKRAKNIYLIKLSSTKDYFIYNQVPQPNDLKMMFASIKKLINDGFIINPIAKIDHPFWGFLIDKLSMPIVYDRMDEHSGFKENASQILSQEKRLIKKADVVLTSSNYLFNQTKKIRKDNLLFIPNGCDFQHFNQVLEKKTEPPSEIRKSDHPIIGYYGAIDQWLDERLLEKIAKAFTDCKIILIGRVNNDTVLKLSKQYNNLILPGEKSYQDLPNYLKFFRVCIIPFKINKLIKATLPVKIFEYLSQGKPVITTAIPEISSFKNQIYFAENHQQFINFLKKALEEDSKNKLEARLKMARSFQWQEIINKFEEKLKNDFYPKVSIIILSFFNWQMTKRCIDSIINYSFYPNFEIIIVDNNSDNQTKQYLKSIKNKRVKVIFSRKNLGFAGGNNVGMKNISSDSEFIILLNNDTLITPGWIHRLVYYAKNNFTGLVGPVTNNIGNEAKINIKYDLNNFFDFFKKTKNYTASHFGQIFPVDRIAAFCWIKRREIYQQIGGFDERFFPAFFEDDDYCLRVKKAGYKIYIADDVFIHHELGKSSGANQDMTKNKIFLENKAKFEKKWRIKWQPHRYRDGVK